MKGFLSYLLSDYTFLSKNLLIFKEIISVTGFFPILNESRFNWFSEILSIIRELKISYNDILLDLQNVQVHKEVIDLLNQLKEKIKLICEVKVLHCELS